MLPKRCVQRLRHLWPLCQEAARPYRQLDPRLLLAVAWIEGWCDRPRTAAAVRKTGRDLERRAHELSRNLGRCGQPRPALAACSIDSVSGGGAGGHLSPVPAIAQYVRDVMFTWILLRSRPDILTPDEQSPLVSTPSPDHPAGETVGLSPLESPDHRRRQRSSCTSDHRTHRGRKPEHERPEFPALIVPVLGATAASNGMYAGAPGLDIVAPFGTPVVATASGLIVFSGADPTGRCALPDANGAVLIDLDRPLDYKKTLYPYAWYTQLSRLRFNVPSDATSSVHVQQGELIGWTGCGGRLPHLHCAVVTEPHQGAFIDPRQLAAWFGWLGGGLR
jgi:hypothetical protein